MEAPGYDILSCSAQTSTYTKVHFYTSTEAWTNIRKQWPYAERRRLSPWDGSLAFGLEDCSSNFPPLRWVPGDRMLSAVSRVPSEGGLEKHTARSIFSHHERHRVLLSFILQSGKTRSCVTVMDPAVNLRKAKWMATFREALSVIEKVGGIALGSTAEAMGLDVQMGRQIDPQRVEGDTAALNPTFGR